MPPELEAIFKLNKGEISNVIRTPYGSHLFKITDKRKDRQMSYEESRKIIHDKLVRERQDKAFHEWLSELKEKAKIEIKHEILAKIS
jgi:parvulin-like peptidyl-prolyl isomerase